MGRGTGGGGRGGGGERGGVGYGFRYFRGFFGPSQATNDVLRRVAIARGLRDVDQLLVSLGKQEYEISPKEAYALLEKEAGHKAVADAALADLYRPGKGYEHCNRLLKRYIKAMKNSCDDHTRSLAKVERDDLKNYCDYSDDELKLIVERHC